MASLEQPRNETEQSTPLDGGAEEWLRRIAVGRWVETVPNASAFALAALGLVQKDPEGGFSATEVGMTYLTARGIPTRLRYAPRR
jgi:hypothetical protein